VKKLLLLAVLLLTGVLCKAQSIFVVEQSFQTNLHVFVVSDPAYADLCVYQVNSPSYAVGNNGKWYFTNNPYYSKKIYFTNNAGGADLKVFFVSDPSWAGWKNRGKAYLLN
jgi:hypothetical protein